MKRTIVILLALALFGGCGSDESPPTMPDDPPVVDHFAEMLALVPDDGPDLRGGAHVHAGAPYTRGEFLFVPIVLYYPPATLADWGMDVHFDDAVLEFVEMVPPKWALAWTFCCGDQLDANTIRVEAAIGTLPPVEMPEAGTFTLALLKFRALETTWTDIVVDGWVDQFGVPNPAYPDAEDFGLSTTEISTTTVGVLSTELVRMGEPGTLWQGRAGNVVTVAARANDPFEGYFESRALMLDWRLPDGYVVGNVAFGYPVSTWDRTGWRQYIHPRSGENRLVALAAAGAGPGEANRLLDEWAVPHNLERSRVLIEPGQAYTFAELEVEGAGLPVWEHLVDGFEGYAYGGVHEATFSAFLTDYHGPGRSWAVQSHPGNMDAIGIEFVQPAAWEALELAWDPRWGTVWDPNDPDTSGWITAGAFRGDGGVAMAIHPPGVFLWADHYGPGERVPLFSVRYYANGPGRPYLKRHGLDADLEGGTIVRQRGGAAGAGR